MLTPQIAARYRWGVLYEKAYEGTHMKRLERPVAGVLSKVEICKIL